MPKPRLHRQVLGGRLTPTRRVSSIRDGNFFARLSIKKFSDILLTVRVGWVPIATTSVGGGGAKDDRAYPCAASVSGAP